MPETFSTLSFKTVTSKVALSFWGIITTISTIDGAISFYNRVNESNNMIEVPSYIQGVFEFVKIIYPVISLLLFFMFLSIINEFKKIYLYLFGEKEGDLRYFIRKVVESHRNHDADILYLSGEAAISRIAFLSDSDKDKESKRQNYRHAMVCFLQAIGIEKNNPQLRNLRIYTDRLLTLLQYVKASDIKHINTVHNINILNVVSEVEKLPIYRNVDHELNQIKRIVFDMLKGESL